MGHCDPRRICVTVEIRSRAERATSWRPTGCRCGRRPPDGPPTTTAPTCCPCGCVTCPGRTPSRSHHHAMRSGITFPCVQITGVPPAAAISRTRCRAALAVVGVGLLGQRRLVVDAHAQFLGQRFERLVTAHPVGGVQLVGTEGEQLTDERFGLCAAVLVQRTLAVVALVAGLAARGAVPHDQHGLRVDGKFGEPAQHFPVVRVAQSASSRPATGNQTSSSTSALGAKSPSILRAAQYRTFLMPCSTG